MEQTNLNTLLVSGCSYTSHNYPSWADWLQDSFDRYINLGFSGTGPRYSFLRISDYFKYHIKDDPKNYTVIVQWSSLLRHDFRVINPGDPENGTWSSGGQIDNNIWFDQKFLNKYYLPIDKANDLIYYIEHLEMLSEKLGFKLYMCYMFEPWVEDFLGEPTHHQIRKDKVISYKRSIYQKTLKELYNKKYWVTPSIEKYSWNIKDALQPVANLPTDQSLIPDHHPSPYQHWCYANYIAKKLNISLNPSYEGLARKADKLFSSTETFFESQANYFKHNINFLK